MLLPLDEPVTFVWQGATLFSTDSEGGRWLLVSGICDETAQIKTILRHDDWKVAIATEVCPHDRKKPELSFNIVTITPESEVGNLDNEKNLPFDGWRFDQTFDLYPEGIGKGDFEALSPLTIWSQLQTYRKKLPNDLSAQHSNGFIQVGVLSVLIERNNYKYIPLAKEMNQVVSGAPSIAYLFELIEKAVSFYLRQEDYPSASIMKCEDFEACVTDDTGAVNVQKVINYIKDNLNAISTAQKEHKKEILETVLQLIFDAYVSEMDAKGKMAAKTKTTAAEAEGAAVKAEAEKVKRGEEIQRKELLVVNPDASTEELVKQLIGLYRGGVNKIAEFIFKLRPDLRRRMGYKLLKDQIRPPSDNGQLSSIDSINIPAVIELIEGVYYLRASLLREIERLVQQSSSQRPAVYKHASDPDTKDRKEK